MEKCNNKKCPREAAPGKKRCERCLLLARKAAKKSRAENMARGLCAQIGCKRQPRQGRTYCGKHAARQSILGQKLRDKRRAEGVCSRCGGVREEGSRLCAVCGANYRKGGKWYS